MRRLRYVGASKALGLQQEAPPSPADSGPSGLDLGVHQLEGSQFQADFSGKGRRPRGPEIHVPAPCRDLAAETKQRLQLPQTC